MEYEAADEAAAPTPRGTLGAFDEALWFSFLTRCLDGKSVFRLASCSKELQACCLADDVWCSVRCDGRRHLMAAHVQQAGGRCLASRTSHFLQLLERDCSAVLSHRLPSYVLRHADTSHTTHI
jgi:hypothetical protein